MVNPVTEWERGEAASARKSREGIPSYDVRNDCAYMPVLLSIFFPENHDTVTF